MIRSLSPERGVDLFKVTQHVLAELDLEPIPPVFLSCLLQAFL